MYSAKVVERLKDLTYLSSLSKKNIAVMSKDNEFGDVVKFMAQINKEDVIQKIRFKATGCSHFIALCSYFCEIVEGKSVADAIKIKEKDLLKFDTFDESRHHVYPIILDTFALMIKKYRKGVEKGLIEPCEVVVEEKIEKKTIKKEKKVNIHEGLHEILVTKKTKKTDIQDVEVVSETKKTSKKTESVNVEDVKVDKSTKRKQVAEKNFETKTEIETKDSDIKQNKAKEKSVEGKIELVQEKKTAKKSKVEKVALETDIKVETKEKKQKRVKKDVEVENFDEVAVVEVRDNNDVDTNALVVVENTPAEVKSEETAVVVEEVKPIAHTKVEHKKTIARKKVVQIDDEIHTDISVEHTELEMEHISHNQPAETEVIEELDIPVIELDNEKPVKLKKEKPAKVKPEKKVKEKAVKTNKVEAKKAKSVESDANLAKAEHLKKLQFGLTNKTTNQNVESKPQATNNLNSMLNRLNAKHQEQGSTTITTTRETRVEVSKKTSSQSIEASKQSSNLQSMRNSLLNLRSQTKTEQEVQEKSTKPEKVKKEKVQKEKPQKEKKVKPEKVRNEKTDVDEDGVEVVYLDDESRNDKEKKGFFTRLFKR